MRRIRKKQSGRLGKSGLCCKAGVLCGILYVPNTRYGVIITNKTQHERFLADFLRLGEMMESIYERAFFTCEHSGRATCGSAALPV
jgi:hypothetical protein